MPDEPQPQPNQTPAAQEGVVDPGIVAWRQQLQGNVTLQPGIEMIDSTGGSFHFRFRGQTFMVSIHRTS